MSIWNLNKWHMKRLAKGHICIAYRYKQHCAEGQGRGEEGAGWYCKIIEMDIFKQKTT